MHNKMHISNVGQQTRHVMGYDKDAFESLTQSRIRNNEYHV